MPTVRSVSTVVGGPPNSSDRAIGSLLVDDGREQDVAGKVTVGERIKRDHHGRESTLHAAGALPVPFTIKSTSFGFRLTEISGILRGIFVNLTGKWTPSGNMASLRRLAWLWEYSGRCYCLPASDSIPCSPKRYLISMNLLPVGGGLLYYG